MHGGNRGCNPVGLPAIGADWGMQLQGRGKGGGLVAAGCQQNDHVAQRGDDQPAVLAAAPMLNRLPEQNQRRSADYADCEGTQSRSLAAAHAAWSSPP
jgi:hypothetical protein